MPRKKVDQENAHDVRDEVDAPDVCTRVRVVSSDPRAGEDGDNLDDTVNAAEQGRLQVGEAESCDNELLLVGEGVRYVVEGREECEKPGLWVSTCAYSQRLDLAAELDS